MELAAYTFETLRQDGEFIVYRGQHRRPTEARSPSLLALTPVLARPALASLRRLEHEYAFQAALEPGWAARPLALTSHEGRPMLLLTDPGGEPLEHLLGQPLALPHFLRLGIGLATALRQMHGCGLIHKDLKPAHILVQRASGEAWLTGFGIASRLPSERQVPAPPESIAGTLAYMAPEQTGRMNRSIDARSDLYALGVTLYQLLTGTLPFTASEPMEWVHCHIARQPVPPSARVATLPAPVSQLIMKLLAKTPEERYQTAAGVVRDLQRCLAGWERQGQITPFALGAHDIPDRLRIPEKLYGRAREVATLLTAFARVVGGGRPELVLVSGYAGIGKSAVVQELHKALVPPRGLFAAGKFDQYKRDIPYATLAQALRSLIRPLLSRSEEELSRWRNALHEALGPNGQLMVGLVPELQAVLGAQPPVPALSPQETQRRFHLVVRRFLNVFARPEHPLALFLDDMQWLDAATLDLLEDLLTQPDVQHVLVIGAYRDNEVDPAHPLVRTLHALRQAGAVLQDIVLAPLTREDLAQLIAEALYCDPAQVGPLAALVHAKTAGNPFFARQFLATLCDEGGLTFAHGAGRWSWDLPRIHAKGYTENVVDFMVGKLTRLPVNTQQALQQLACLGNSAESDLLEVVFEDSQEALRSALQEALHSGLVLHADGAYTFLHDRVQEAAYALSPEYARAETHLRIGRRLAAHTPPEKQEEAIFEIVNQLNRGAALITARGEREQLAEFNLTAGKRAKASTAYASALSYLIAGVALLADDGWERRPDLMFALELYRAECEFLTGALTAAEARLTMLSSRAATPMDQATVACLRADLYTTRDRSDRAVDVGLTYLRHLGMEWSPHPTEEEARREYERTWTLLGSRAIEELIDLPVMSDPVSLATLDVLNKLLPPALYTDVNLYFLIISRMVNLSLEHGNTDVSCIGYAALGGFISGPRFGDYEAGFRFGRLGYDLAEQRGLQRFKARIYILFGNLVMPWTKHVRTGRELIRRAFDAAHASGDLTFATYSCHNLITNRLAAGDPLVDVQRDAEAGLAFAEKARFGLMIDRIAAQLGLIRTLRGLTPVFGCFNDEGFDEFQVERRLTSDPMLARAACWYWIRKLQARFFAGDYVSAVEASVAAHRLLWMSPPYFETAEAHFYGALSHAASCAAARPAPYRQHVQALIAHHRQLRAWAERCPENFANRAALVGAEIARIEGRELDAERLYEQAIHAARENGFVHHEALANELAARFYAARGFATIAQAYLRHARYYYSRWGADGKVRQLDQFYPHLREQEPVPGPTSTIGASVEQLDLATVLKVSQAVSGEIVLEKLIDTLMRTAIEHAGATRGLLLLPQGAALHLAAEATTIGDTVRVEPRATRAAAAALPESILQYVVRTQASVRLDDAAAAHPFAADPYVRQQHARSILCVPLMHRAALIGVLYLENTLTPHVFTPARLAVLTLLASQAATSLENARLYRDAQHMEASLHAAQTLSHTGSFGWRPASEEIVWSEETYHILGYERGTTPTLDLVWTRLHPDDLVLVREALDRATRHGTALDFEHRLLLPDGTVKYVHVVAHAVSAPSRPLEYVGAIMDITARKHADEALRKSQGELAHMARVMTMGELVASIAHEVNQPLAAVVNSASACVRWLDAQKLEEARRSASRAIAEGHRASEIIGRIRSMVHKELPEKYRLDVNETIQEVMALVRSEIQRHGVVLETQLSEHVPIILADRIQLQQVLLNLIMNAIEAMRSVDEGPRALLVRSGTDATQHVVIAVQDSGPGFDPQSLEHLFEAFYTTKPHGLGMGLAISRSIIDAHGGRLWATANVPCGAVFQFTLPISGERVA